VSCALVLGACLLAPGVAAAAPGGKLYGKAGNWEVRKFGTYCAANASFDGDRAMRISAARSGQSSFGFMGQDAASFKKSTISFKFSDNRNTFSREAVPFSSKAEDGGAPWIIVIDPVDQPSHAGDWATAKTMVFNYKVGSRQLSETFQLRDIDKAWEKVWNCAQG
jgi:hypothetical protein